MGVSLWESPSLPPLLAHLWEGGGGSMDTARQTPAHVRAKIKAVGRERKRRGGGRKGRCTVFIYTLLRKVLRERVL